MFSVRRRRKARGVGDFVDAHEGKKVGIYLGDQ